MTRKIKQKYRENRPEKTGRDRFKKGPDGKRPSQNKTGPKKDRMRKRPDETGLKRPDRFETGPKKDRTV